MLNNKKNYLYTLFSSFGGLVISLVLGVLTVPISLHYWGKELYGIYALINSIIIYFSISNLGLNAAANVLIGKNSNVSVKWCIFKRSIFMGGVSISLFGLAFVMLNLVTHKWVYFIGEIPHRYFSETYWSIIFLVVFFLVNNILSMVDSILYGFQKLYVQKFFEIFVNIFTFLSIILTIYLKQNLVFFVICVNSVKSISYIIKAIYVYYIIYKPNVVKDDFNVSLLSISEKQDTAYQTIFGSGIKFFIVGIAAMVVWNTDNLVISHFMSVDLVTPYSITFRLYTICFSIIFIINTSFLPIISKELGQNNWALISKIHNALIVLMSVIGGLVWIGGILFLKDIIQVWTGLNGYAGSMVVICLGGYAYLLSIINVNANMLNTLNFVSAVIWVGWLEAFVNFTASVFFLKYYGLGGVALGTFLGALLGPWVWLPFSIVKKSNNRIQYDFKFVFKHLFFIILPCLVVGLMMTQLIHSLLLILIFGVLLSLSYLCLSYLCIPQNIRENLNLLVLWKRRL